MVGLFVPTAAAAAAAAPAATACGIADSGVSLTLYGCCCRESTLLLMMPSRKALQDCLSALQVSTVLSITAFNAGVLCQFTGCCNRTGTIHYYVQQVIPIAIAVGYAVLVNTTVKPWYASFEALDVLAGAVESSAQILEQSYSALVQVTAMSCIAVSVRAAQCCIWLPLTTSLNLHCPHVSPQFSDTSALMTGRTWPFAVKALMILLVF